MKKILVTGLTLTSTDTGQTYIIYENDKVNSILGAAMKNLSTEQLVALRDCLIRRTPPTGQTEELSREADKCIHPLCSCKADDRDCMYEPSTPQPVTREGEVTAITEFIENAKTAKEHSKDGMVTYDEVIAVATSLLAKEREQIINAYIINDPMIRNKEGAELYFEQTFKK